MTSAVANKKKKLFRNPFKKKKETAPVVPQTPDRPPQKLHLLDTPGAMSEMTTNTVNHKSALLPGMSDDATDNYVFEDVPSPIAVKRSKPVPTKSYLSRSKWFQKMSAQAFDLVDQDGSGSVDEKELYSGLLLIHLKLGSYAGPAACKPVDRERVHAVFVKMDVDNSGSLDREEFTQVMTVLCSNVLTRVMAQWALTLILVPLMAQYILVAISWAAIVAWTNFTELENYDEITDRCGEIGYQAKDWVVERVPGVVLAHLDTAGSKLFKLLESVPDSVWDTLPVTLMSCMLGIIFVPYTIFTIDEFFASMADRKKKEMKAR